MHPDAFKALKRIFDLVDAGVLPMGAINRVVYHSHGGHLFLHSYARPRHEMEFKCVTCLQTFKVADEPHPCTGTPEVYETNSLRIGRWRCAFCEHEWDAEDGDLCPKCLAGPTTGTHALLRGTQPLPDSTRQAYPVLRELNDIRMSGVPLIEVFEVFAEQRGLQYDDALLLISEEWWRRVTADPIG